MPQIFHYSSNNLSKVGIIVVGLLTVGVLGLVAFELGRRFVVRHAAGRIPRTAGSVQPHAPRRLDGHRLPLLPHVG